MTFPFLNKGGSDQILAIDLGTRTTKAVLMDRADKGLSLSRFAVQDAPIYDKALPQGLLTEHLRNVVDALQPRTKQATIAIGAATRFCAAPNCRCCRCRRCGRCSSSIPRIICSRTCGIIYLTVTSSRRATRPSRKRARPASSNIRCGWAGPGARASLTLESAAKEAGLIPNQVTLTVLGPINALELAQPEVFTKEIGRRWWIWASKPAASASLTTANFA